MNGRPSSHRLDYRPDTADYWDVSHAAACLTQAACSLSNRHIQDHRRRMQFNREVAYCVKRIAEDVEQGIKSPEQGLWEIDQEYKALYAQSIELAKKSAGAVAGILQIGTGVSICYLSAGTLCVAAGIPMMAFGMNNVYENGRNLIENRNDTRGPVRSGYQMAARALGGSEREGNIAYGATDLSLSFYGMWRLVLKPEAWKLFRYIKSDKVRAVKVMGAGPLVLEVGVDMMTGEQVYVEIQKE